MSSKPHQLQRHKATASCPYTHVDTFLDSPTVCPSDSGKDLYEFAVTTVVKAWLTMFRLPAVMRNPTQGWLDSQVITCEYAGDIHRLVGCSTMGDIWLTKDLTATSGYQIRTYVCQVSGWAVKGINKPVRF